MKKHTKKVKGFLSYRFILLSGVLLINLIMGTTDIRAKDLDRETEKDPIITELGVYITSVYDFNLKKESYEITFWIWFLENSDEYRPYETTEVINAKSYERESSNENETPMGNWSYSFYRASMIHEWDISNFPFDRQILKIYLEDTVFDATQLIYVPDLKNSKIDPDVALRGWEIENFDIRTSTKTYETTYGNPGLGVTSDFSRATIEIILKRNGTRLFFTIFIGTYTSFILSILGLFLHPTVVVPRFGLITASMITVIGNHYIISTVLPDVTYFTLSDRILMSTFISITVTALIMVIVSYFVVKEKMKTARSINNTSRIAIILSYITFNLIFILRALVT